MRTSRALLTLALGIVGLAAAPRDAAASSGMGAYGVIDRVIWEPGPGPAGAQRVQLHGAFALRSEWGSDNPYGVATCGYLYYYCPDGHTALCQLQWADFAKAAGTSKCVVFGGRPFDQQGSIRLPGQPAVKPDAFPIHMGVVADVNYESCPDVKVKFASCPTSSGGGGAPDGGMTTPPPPTAATTSTATATATAWFATTARAGR